MPAQRGSLGTAAQPAIEQGVRGGSLPGPDRGADLVGDGAGMVGVGPARRGSRGRFVSLTPGQRQQVASVVQPQIVGRVGFLAGSTPRPRGLRWPSRTSDRWRAEAIPRPAPARDSPCARTPDRGARQLLCLLDDQRGVGRRQGDHVVAVRIGGRSPRSFPAFPSKTVFGAESGRAMNLFCAWVVAGCKA